jgi:P4 family phage/plasmid primase-like protien
MPELHQIDRDDLVNSGLDEKTIAEMGCFSLSAADIKLRAEVHTPSDGYAIPYHGETDQTGETYTRYRLRETSDRGMKYVSGKGDDPTIYVPRGLNSLPPSDLLVITEGEKKAAKACQEGLHCVALQGVHSWADPAARAAEIHKGTSPSSETPPLAKLLEVCRRYRWILILGDSDLLLKEAARSGLERLQRSLRLLSVEAHLAYCPPPRTQKDGDDEIKKQGLDDWLVNRGSACIATIRALALGASAKQHQGADLFHANEVIKTYADRLLFSLGAWHQWNGATWKVHESGLDYVEFMESLGALYRTAADRVDEYQRVLVQVYPDAPFVKILAPHLKAQSTELRKCGAQIGKRRTVDAVLAVVQTRLHVPSEAWNQEPHLLGVKNGVVDLRTGTLIAPHPTQRINWSTNINYVPNAPAPNFLRFFEEIQPDPDVRAYIQELLGYAALGSALEQKFFVFHGSGANGKSVFLNAVMSALGDYATKISPDTLAEQKAGNQRYELAGLPGKRLVSVSETSDNFRLDEALVKTITGGAPLCVRQIYREPFYFQPVFTPILDANNVPLPTNLTPAFLRRLVAVPFEIVIPPESRDIRLPEVLESELEGILAFIVEGALRYHVTRKLQAPAAIDLYTKRICGVYNPIHGFIATHIRRMPKVETRMDAIYHAFEAYCQQEGMERTPSIRSLATSLYDAGFEKRKKGVILYEGVSLVGMHEDDEDGCLHIVEREVA